MSPKRHNSARPPVAQNVARGRWTFCSACCSADGEAAGLRARGAMFPDYARGSSFSNQTYRTRPDPGGPRHRVASGERVYQSNPRRLSRLLRFFMHILCYFIVMAWRDKLHIRVAFTLTLAIHNFVRRLLVAISLQNLTIRRYILGR